MFRGSSHKAVCDLSTPWGEEELEVREVKGVTATIRTRGFEEASAASSSSPGRRLASRPTRPSLGPFQREGEELGENLNLITCAPGQGGSRGTFHLQPLVDLSALLNSPCPQPAPRATLGSHGGVPGRPLSCETRGGPVLPRASSRFGRAIPSLSGSDYTPPRPCLVELTFSGNPEQARRHPLTAALGQASLGRVAREQRMSRACGSLPSWWLTQKAQ